MRLVYDIFFLVFSIIYLPYFLLKGKFHKDFLQRFGIFNRNLFGDIAPTRPLWLHAVSVGEMKAAEVFITRIQNQFPPKRFVITNVTKTGHSIAVSIARNKDIVIYFPVDLSFVVRRLVRLIKPSLFIAIETEIWPNLITELARNNIPVVLINGRISESSFRNYLVMKPFIRSILKKVTLFCMRSESDAQRIEKLGAPSERIRITGNMKFDTCLEKDHKKIWPVIENRKVWLSEPLDLIIAGSTHRGEDRMILKSFKILKETRPDLSLLIAPRHIERTSEIVQLIEEHGFKPVKMTDVEKRCVDLVKDARDEAFDKNSIFVLDSIGRLSLLYGLATVVFMGGSLVPHGGHNFIEPAACGKPIITGRYVHNFRDVYELFSSNEAIELVNDESRLLDSLRNLLSDENRRREIGERARKIVAENAGSTDRNIELIKQFL